MQIVKVVTDYELDKDVKHVVMIELNGSKDVETFSLMIGRPWATSNPHRLVGKIDWEVKRAKVDNT